MNNLISKDEKIKKSYVYIGYLILKHLSKNKKNKISIFDISSNIQKHTQINSKQFIYSLTFLYSTGLIDFQEPYIIKK